VALDKCKVSVKADFSLARPKPVAFARELEDQDSGKQLDPFPGPGRPFAALLSSL